MTKPILLLLHGALGTKTQYVTLQEALQPHFNLHTLNFEGHGDQPTPDRPFRISYFAENVQTYLDTHNLKAVNIFGHSMGGYVGLYLAYKNPDYVAKVFTLGTKFAWTPEFVRKEIRNLNPDRILQKVPHFAQLLQVQHIATPWRVLLQKTEEMMVNLGDSPVLSFAHLSQIQQSVRIGLGDRDYMVTLAESEAIYRILPQGQFQVLPATSHPFEKVSITKVTTAINDFLEIS